MASDSLRDIAPIREDRAETRPTRRISTARKVLFVSVVYAALAVFVECGARLAFFFADNLSPYYLTYGFAPDVERQSDGRSGYSKFQPNSVYHYKASASRTIAMRINGDGFRALGEFSKPKAPGVFRIVCLGASSTFGLFDEDDETYPFLLQQQLRQALHSRDIEVFNLGIPQFRTDNIVALVRQELAALQPDLVTFYEGYNSAMVVQAPQQAGRLYSLKNWMKYHSVAYRGLHPFVVTAYLGVVRTINADVVGLPHLDIPIDLPREKVDTLRTRARREFRRDLETLADLVADLGAGFVLVTQTYTLHLLPRQGLGDRWRTYEEEVAVVDSLLRRDGEILAPYATILIHRDLMDELRAMSRERGLPIVDGIRALDTDRDRVMASMVHLTPEGNARLARAIGEVLLAQQLVTTRLDSAWGQPPAQGQPAHARQ